MTVTYTADLRVGGRTPIAVVVDIGVHWREHVVANRARLVVVFISDINGSSQTLSIHRRICITHTHTCTPTTSTSTLVKQSSHKHVWETSGDCCRHLFYSPNVVNEGKISIRRNLYTAITVTHLEHNGRLLYLPQQLYCYYSVRLIYKYRSDCIIQEVESEASTSIPAHFMHLM